MIVYLLASAVIMSLRFVFVMDPLDRIDISGDSTFVLMLEAQHRGYECYYAHQTDLELRGEVPWAVARSVEVRRVVGDHFTLGEPVELRLDDVDAVFLRTDPPIGMPYIVSTYVLDRVNRDRVVMVNDPRSVRDCNEKLYTLEWADLMPPTVVASNQAQIRAHIDAMGDAVVKPLLGAGGAGIVRLKKGDKNTRSIIDLLTKEGTEAIMVQAYLPSVTEGDKRIILIDGVAVGVTNRRPSGDDLRSNMHVGGVAEAAQLTDRDKEICDAMAPDLVRRGLIFVGIDVIGGHLTEVNVTSPTGLQEINRFDGVSLEADLIDCVEKKRAEKAR